MRLITIKNHLENLVCENLEKGEREGANSDGSRLDKIKRND